MNKSKIIKVAGLVCLGLAAFGVGSEHVNLLAAGVGLCFGADLIGEVLDNLV